MRCTVLSRAVRRLFTTVTCVLPPACIYAFFFGDMRVLVTALTATGVASMAWIALLLARSMDRRGRDWWETVHARQMFTLGLMAEMTAAMVPEPEPGSDKATGPLRAVS